MGPTVFESQPTNSAADAKADQDEDEHLVGAFASSAKQRFLERQKEAEEAGRKKSTPGIVSHPHRSIFSAIVVGYLNPVVAAQLACKRTESPGV